VGCDWVVCELIPEAEYFEFKPRYQFTDFQSQVTVSINTLTSQRYVNTLTEAFGGTVNDYQVQTLFTFSFSWATKENQCALEFQTLNHWGKSPFMTAFSHEIEQPYPPPRRSSKGTVYIQTWMKCDLPHTTQVNSALHPFRVAKSSTGFGWGKGGKVNSAGWQVTLRDPIWYVISRSCEVSLHTAISRCRQPYYNYTNNASTCKKISHNVEQNRLMIKNRK